jgi:hypothetical protein
MASKPSLPGTDKKSKAGVFSSGSGGGAKPGGSSGGGAKPSGSGNFDSASPIPGDPFLPLTKETATTYGGTKPGKAPTIKPPEAPDPFKLIKAQGVENRVNEIGPSGSTTYSRDPVTGVWTANRSFSPELQGIFNQQVEMAGEDPNAYNQQIADTMFERSRAQLDPVFEQQNRALEQKLADQGLPIGSEAFSNEWDRTNRMQNEALTGASREAMLSGTQIGMQQRQNEFNQMAALLGGQQVGPTAPIDVTGPFNSQYQGQLNSVNAANANSAQRNAQTTSGAATLAMALASMFCWVAEELYGHDSPKVSRIRAYLTGQRDKNTLTGWFARLYQKNGLFWAALVRRFKPAKIMAKTVFTVIDMRAK